MKCLFCNKGEAKIKYCSEVCNKRAYALRKFPNKKSFFNKDNSEFWNTETGIGFKWEIYAAKKLKAIHIPFNSSGADLDWGGIPVDVKVCNLYSRKLKRGKPVTRQHGWWVFNRNKFKPEVKFFFCICLGKDGEVQKELFIPANDFKGNGITVGYTSKYDQFKL